MELKKMPRFADEYLLTPTKIAVHTQRNIWPHNPGRHELT